MFFNLTNNLKLRAFGRHIGVSGSAARLSTRSRYELRLGEKLMGAIRAGDCVWDVGANVGYYTRQIAARVGGSGSVLAFEPISSTFARLSANVAGTPQVRCLQLALGAREQHLVIDVVPESPYNTLLETSTGSLGESISVTSGDRLVAEGYPAPSILKIDVEGFEEDVVWGLRDTLSKPSCRGMFLEVHFALLERRGFLRAPERLISVLKDLGYSARWISLSHLSATRE